MEFHTTYQQCSAIVIVTHHPANYVARTTSHLFRPTKGNTKRNNKRSFPLLSAEFAFSFSPFVKSNRASFFPVRLFTVF